MKSLFRFVSVLLVLFGSMFSSAQGLKDTLAMPKTPPVSVLPVAPVVVHRGTPGKVELAFRVHRGLHINSNKPQEETLVATSIRLSPPTDVMIGKISYPAGKEMSFAFMPEEKLSVYEGSFSISALVRTSQSIPYGRYRVHGTLRYQACDNRQCYPPEQIPVAFDVKVQKATSGRVRRNPGQSPHIH